MTPSSQLPWKPWHQVVTLRDDLRTGELALNQFAADLYRSADAKRQAPAVRRPTPVFRPDLPPHNLRELAKDVALRLAGQNDKAVQQLEASLKRGSRQG